MRKEKLIKKYGKEKYEKRLETIGRWKEAHKERIVVQSLVYRRVHRVAHKEEQNKQRNQRGGKYYGECLIKNRTGLRGKRSGVRHKHGKVYHQYKKIIDPKGLTQIHHEWLLGTANYKGVALVEADQHMHGYIDVIQILEGEITLFTEEVIRGK